MEYVKMPFCKLGKNFELNDNLTINYVIVNQLVIKKIKNFKENETFDFSSSC